MEKTIPPPNPGPPLDPSVSANEPVAQPDPQNAPELVLQQYPQPAPLSVQQMPQQFFQTAVQPVQQMVVVQQQMPTACPGQMLCPHCKISVVTKTEHKSGVLAWLICGLLGLLGCWPCCIIPFFVDGCKDVVHSCPTCNNVLHIYTRR